MKETTAKAVAIIILAIISVFAFSKAFADFTPDKVFYTYNNANAQYQWRGESQCHWTYSGRHICNWRSVK